MSKRLSKVKESFSFLVADKWQQEHINMNVIIILCMVISVSYTHLDVYKRQVSESGLDKR